MIVKAPASRGFFSSTSASSRNTIPGHKLARSTGTNVAWQGLRRDMRTQKISGFLPLHVEREERVRLMLLAIPLVFEGWDRVRGADV
jgi:hypothetical protein